MTCQLMIVSFATFFFQYAQAKEISVTGVWCGKWDNIYATCFNVKKVAQGYQVAYRWEETIGRGFHKKTLEGQLANANTLDMSGKYLIIDLKDHNKAIAVGIFEHHSRIAQMQRQSTQAQ